MTSKDHLMAVAQAMSTFTARCTNLIVGFDPAARDQVRPVGSGTLVEIPDRGSFILTAAHVIHDAAAYETVLHALGPGSERMGICPGENYCLVGAQSQEDADHGVDHARVDVGVIRPERFGGDGLEPLPVDPFMSGEHTSAGLEGELLFVTGFPGQGLQALIGGVFTERRSWCTVLAEPEPGFNPELHLFLKHAATEDVEVFDTDGRPARADRHLPDGLSGSPVWCTSAGAEGWEPSRARIVGVVTRWSQDGRTLIATRIEVVRDRLLAFLQQDS